jgi:hypothetical protein
VKGHQILTMNKKILVALTTYSGNFEQQLILLKVVRHIRNKNGSNIFLLVVSDGIIKDKLIYQLADYVIERPGPCGLQQGELSSIWQIINFAKKHRYRTFIKSAGDIIMTKQNWAQNAIDYYNEMQVKLLSTHWNYDNSWTVGTKFFVADTSFIEKTLPRRVSSKLLEDAFSEKIFKTYSDYRKFIYLISSSTGYRHEVRNVLKKWGWEHSHRIHKFIFIDEFSPFIEKWLGKLILYPTLRIKREIFRLFPIKA